MERMSFLFVKQRSSLSKPPIRGRGAAGMLNLGNLNLHNEETCIGLPYLFEFLNLFTFIYLFIYLTQTTEVHKTIHRQKQNYRELKELPTTLKFSSHVTLVNATE